MKFYLSLFFLCFSAIGFSVFGQVSTLKRTVNGKEYYVHTIQKGQTVYALTKLYGVTDKEIYAANPGAESGITAGKDLLIPIKSNTTPTVQQNTTTNPSPKPTPPKPVEKQNPSVRKVASYTSHTVSKSETLYGLSKQYSITVDDIISANPDVVNGLKAGMVVRIPQFEEVSNAEIELADTKEEPNKEDAEIEKEAVSAPGVVVADMDSKFKSKKDCSNHAVLKNQYTVAVLMPFGNNPKLDNKQARVAFQFYAGMQLAQQLYTPKQVSLNWKVFNTGESDDSLTIAKLINSGSLDNVDMIVGPLYTSGLSQVAAYAAARRIPVLSPTSRTNQVLEGNPYIIKTTPSPQTFLLGLAEYMTQHFDHIILVEPSGVQDSLTMRALQAELQLLINTKGSSKSIAYMEAGKGSSMDLVKPGVKNLIYYPTKKELAVTNFLTGLRKLKNTDKVTVMGDESWLRFRNFDPEYYSNVGLRVPVMHFATNQVASFEPFVTKFRADYKTDPEIYAYKGYDAVCYVTDLLENYGSSCPECLRFETPTYLLTPFKMLKTKEGGFDNKGVTVLVVEDYQLRIETN